MKKRLGGRSISHIIIAPPPVVLITLALLMGARCWLYERQASGTPAPDDGVVGAAWFFHMWNSGWGNGHRQSGNAAYPPRPIN